MSIGKTILYKGEASQFLILAGVLIFVWVIFTAMMIGYFAKFKKIKSERKIYNKWTLWTTLVTNIIMFICWVLLIIFNLLSSQVFGNPASLTAYNTEIALAVIGYVSFLIIFIMFCFSQYYGIAFTNDEIIFMSKTISYKDVTKIIIDKNSKFIYINYKNSENKNKKIFFLADSKLGLFIKTNESLIGIDITNESQKAYFESLTKN